jgi:protein involved in polysaccharide export with SLBB domain
MVTGIHLPTFGCWEITAHYEDDELTFVVWVPGDGVMVSKAGIIYVVGDVHKPMRVVMKDTGPITVLKALATAEGTNPTADLHNVKIVRKGENGQTEVPVDIQKIMQAKAADVTLQDGDILFVPHSGERRQQEYFYDVPPSGPLQGATPIYIR